MMAGMYNTVIRIGLLRVLTNCQSSKKISTAPGVIGLNLQEKQFYDRIIFLPDQSGSRTRVSCDLTLHSQG